MDRYCNITICCNMFMSQISLPTPDNKSFMVGSEAKNTLPTNTRNNFSYTDMVGLSWIFLDDSLDIGDYT